MSNHTPEPWYYDEGQLYSRLEGCVDINEPRNLDRAVACVNACAGINPEAVPDVVAALREVYEGYLSEPWAEFDWSHWGEIAGAALAKLEDVG